MKKKAQAQIKDPVENYLGKEHRKEVSQFEYAWIALENIEKIAETYEISDIAQDNNLKLLQTLVLFGFENQAGREGSDAIDRYGNSWELKTVNLNLTRSFSTNHHTNLERIAAFRAERWLFSMYEGINLKEVYAVNPKDLEPYFSDWEQKVLKKIAEGNDTPHLNNPKIPARFVREVGVSVFPQKEGRDPADILRFI